MAVDNEPDIRTNICPHFSVPFPSTCNCLPGTLTGHSEQLSQPFPSFPFSPSFPPQNTNIVQGHSRKSTQSKGFSSGSSDRIRKWTARSALPRDHTVQPTTPYNYPSSLLITAKNPSISLSLSNPFHREIFREREREKMWRNRGESFWSSTMESDSDSDCSLDSSTMAGNDSFSPSAEGISIYERQIDSTMLRVYTVNFFGTAITATVTSTASVARRWIHSTRYFNRHYYHSHRLVAGIGVQWVPGGKFSPAVTLQICVGRRCLIYQLANAVRFPTVLRRFLLSPEVTLVGIWNHSDAQKLMLSRHHVETKELIDLRLHVRRENGESMRRASMEEIVEEYLGYEGVGLDHWVSRSDWDDESLSFDQVRQACVDAYVSFEIGKRIRAWEIKI